MFINDNFINLLKCSINANQIKQIDDIDLNELFDESQKQSVQALLFSVLPHQNEPSDIYLKWKNLAFKILFINTQNQLGHINLTTLLTNNNIRFVTIKGFASAYYYPNPEFRSMGDIDFYVDPNDFNKCHEILINNGFLFISSERDHDWLYKKDNIIYEMHFSLPGIPDDDDGKKVQTLFNTLIDDSRTIETKYGAIVIPSEFHHGLILLLHTASHLLGEGIGLRHLCDWAVFVNSFSEPYFVSVFKEKLTNVGLWRFAQILTLVSEKYLEINKNNWANLKIDSSTIESLATELFQNGNFGIKKDDNKSGMLVSNGFSAKIGNKSNFLQLFSAISQIVITHWPVAKKIKIIIPIGWFYFGIRYFIRSLNGKREKLNLSKMYSDATKRKKLYKQFGLFEINELNNNFENYSI